MKIIHCSDIHLGASMRTHLTIDKARKRQEELLATFSRMVNFAITNDIAAIIIAGDLLDTSECDIKTRNFLINTIADAKNVEFYYLCGNHDENNILLRGEELPTNLHVFGTEWTTFRLGEVNITGATLGNDNARLYDSLHLPANEFNIVVLHGDIELGHEINKPDTVNFNMLKNRNIDYLALGHIHSYREGKLDNRATYCYSGCLEGRGFDECGQKGFVLLEIENKKLNSRFIPFARRELAEIYVDISGLNTTREILNAINEQIKDVPAESLVRVVLAGEYTLNTEKALTLLESTLETRFYYVQVKDKSHLKLDINRYANDISIAGEFVRLVRESDLSPEEQEKVIVTGLHALAGREVNE